MSLTKRSRSIGHIVAHGALAQLAVLVRLVEPRNRSAIFQIRLAFVFDMARIVSLASVARGASYPDLARRSRRAAPTGSGGAVVTEVPIQRRPADPEVPGDVFGRVTVRSHPPRCGDLARVLHLLVART